MSVGAVVDAVLCEVEAGRPVAFCAVVATHGSTPQSPGAVLCVDSAATITGTLGGGCVEADVRRRAHELLVTGRSEVLSFSLDSDFGFDDGMICGGQMEIAVSVLAPATDLGPWRRAHDQLLAGKAATLPLQVETQAGPMTYRLNVEAAPELVIAGAGHISRVLARVMLPLGFTIHVIDDRAQYANVERFASPVKPVVGDIAKTLRKWPIDPGTYIVIVTRGHKHDEQALAAVLDSPARYIGMIGSRRKVAVIFDDLRQDGASQEQLDRVHTPIGVKIGAVTVEEIAVSIAAELVAIRRQDKHRAVEGPFPIEG